MHMRIDRRGVVRCIYSELINLSALGSMAIRRASYVEPNDLGQWTADLRPTQGPVLGPFQHRSEALTAEMHWLEADYLSCQGTNRHSSSQEGKPNECVTTNDRPSEK